MATTDRYNGNRFLPKANTPKEYTSNDIQEVIKCMKDPVYFAKTYFKIVHVDHGLIPFELYEYQIEAINRFQNSRNLIINASRQCGKLLLEDQLIPLYDGRFKPIKDINIGDTIIGSDGCATSVTGKSPRQFVNIYRITFDDKTFIDCCEDHQWTVYDRFHKHRKVTTTTKKLLESKWYINNSRGYKEYAYYIPNIKPVDYCAKQLPIDPYIFGVWLGDGHRSSNLMTTHISEIEFYESQGITFGNNYAPETTPSVHTRAIKNISIGCLKQLGVFNNKHIPDCYLYGSIEQRIALLQGIIDTDGHINKNGAVNIQLSLKVPRLLEDIEQLLNSLGFKVTKKYFENNNFKIPAPSLRLSFTPDREDFDVCRMERKKKYLKTNLKYKRYVKSRTIQNIEFLKQDYGYCISVSSSDQLFAVGKQYQLTHNTSVATVIILHFALFNPNKNIAILANKGATSREILNRIKIAYEYLPDFLKGGVKEWNKGSVVFENGSKIFAEATSSDSVRGQAIALLYIDEHAFIPNWDDFSASVLPTLSSGKETKMVFTSCVTDDTFVWTDKGLLQVKDFIDYQQIEHPNIGYEIDRYSVMGMTGLNNGNIMVNSGRAETRKINTTFSDIQCSTDHKLWACKDGKFGWFKSSELSAGDFVSIRYGYNDWVNDDDISNINLTRTNKHKNIFEPPQKITPELAYVLGFYLGDGSAGSQRNDNGITTCRWIDLTTEDDITSLINRADLPISTTDNLRYRISSTDFVNFMIELGFDLSLKSSSKIIPQRVTRFSKVNIAALLRGMFDADGCISNVRGKSRISYCTTSMTMAKQIQIILQNFGILSSIRSNVTRSNQRVKAQSHVYIIEISQQDNEKFIEEIGFDILRKREKYITPINKKRSNGHDIIPFFDKWRKDYKITQRGLSRLKNSNGHINRYKCIQLCGVNIPDIVSPHIKWEKIKSIEAGYQKVYDFSLDDVNNDQWCHSVLYNGLIGHQTPNGLNHYYYYVKGAREEKNDFALVEVPWTRVPGRDENWKEKTISDLNGDLLKFEQEFNLLFEGSSSTLINGNALKSLTPIQPVHFDSNSSQYVRPIENHTYVISADVSRGKGLDYSAFSVIDISTTPYEQVFVYRNNLITPIDYASVILHIAKLYNNAYILVEINDLGQQVADFIYDDEYENLLGTQNKGKKGKILASGFGNKIDRGIRTTMPVKAVGCASLKLLIEQGKLTIKDKNTIQELSTFSKINNSYGAEPGNHDDLVMGLVLFSWMTLQKLFKDLFDQDIMKTIREKTEEELSEEMLPFGFVENGMDFYNDSTEVQTVDDIDYWMKT